MANIDLVSVFSVIVAFIVVVVLVYKITWDIFTKDENQKLKIKVNEDITKLEEYKKTLEKVIEKNSTELNILEEEIVEKSKEYTVENIYSRKSFYKISNVMISIAKRENMALSLLIINVDNLHNINETYGRKAGNDLLKMLISLLEFYSRSSDTIARFSGGEFAILLPNTAKDGAEKLASKLKRISSKKFIELYGENISFDLAIFAEEVDLKKDTYIHEVLKRSEKTLYLKNKA
ncbi:MAG: GGDEF domain-containing protein [Campylobacterota bacterium]|nr:GGDEF domain-containing protein [Campylobacterota bacterium]